MQHARKPGNCDATGFDLECSVLARRLSRGAGGGMNNVAFDRDMPPSVTIANSPPLMAQYAENRQPARKKGCFRSITP